MDGTSHFVGQLRFYVASGNSTECHCVWFGTGDRGTDDPNGDSDQLVGVIVITLEARCCFYKSQACYALKIMVYSTDCMNHLPNIGQHCLR